jgi:hypothetical protein
MNILWKSDAKLVQRVNLLGHFLPSLLDTADSNIRIPTQGNQAYT